MKECPICNARAFDDAQVCYGCLHRFGDDDVRVQPAAAPVLQAPAIQDASPTLVIAVQAMRNEDGGVEWHCDVDGQPRRMLFA